MSSDRTAGDLADAAAVHAAREQIVSAIGPLAVRPLDQQAAARAQILDQLGQCRLDMPETCPTSTPTSGALTTAIADLQEVTQQVPSTAVPVVVIQPLTSRGAHNARQHIGLVDRQRGRPEPHRPKSTTNATESHTWIAQSVPV